MVENTKIEWAHHTFNPWRGCQKVSAGCDFCYAEALVDHRFKQVQWGPHGERLRTSDQNWNQPLRWAKNAAILGERHRVFCASLADWMDNKVPQQWRIDLAALIQMTPELDWLLLTKRPENFETLLPWLPSRDPPENVWLGVSAEDQANYTRRYRILRQWPATCHFISYEPALGPITQIAVDGSTPDWIIMGGESGKHARNMPAEWARDMRDLCDYHDVPFFMKQMTHKLPIPADLMVREFPFDVRP